MSDSIIPSPDHDLVSGDLGFDTVALREKYRVERERRVRPDGSAQYRRPDDEYVDDPYVDSTVTREPLTDRMDAVVVGGGFGGCSPPRGCARPGCGTSG